MATPRNCVLVLLIGASLSGVLSAGFVGSTAGKSRASAAPARCSETTESIQTDLSGTYPGTINYPPGSVSDKATLEIGAMQSVEAIKFNPFTITSDNSK